MDPHTLPRLAAMKACMHGSPGSPRVTAAWVTVTVPGAYKAAIQSNSYQLQPDGRQKAQTYRHTSTGRHTLNHRHKQTQAPTSKMKEFKDISVDQGLLIAGACVSVCPLI